ncbi:hypothetical protein ACS0TY_015580 [Phlomoides rotata]
MASDHGEWWNANVIDAENIKITIGGAPNISDAYTINGCPRDTHAHQRFRIKVVYGNICLLCIINGALDNQLFFMIVNHNIMVVAIDALYTTHTPQHVVLVASRQTIDVLLIDNQPIMPDLSPFNDIPTAHKFNSNLTALVTN